MTQIKELYVQIKDEVADQIIKHGLSKTESKLFFYLLKLDRFGDKPIKVKVAEILLATGIGKTAYHAAIARFEAMGWFDFKHSDVEITNFCTPTKKFAKTNSQTEIPNSQTEIPNSETGKTNQKTGKTNSQRLKPLPAKGSTAPQTIQTYSDLIQTLSPTLREGFEKFCNRKIDECSFKIGSRKAWLNSHGLEYWEEFQSLYPKASGVDQSSGNSPPGEKFTISELKRMYPHDWEGAAAHFGIEIMEG
ncbi:MAG TPA: hypothetical protein VK211_29205 [Kamptonema sp.]|nr:hypothetical protein [Kamptonema sp.]